MAEKEFHAEPLPELSDVKQGNNTTDEPTSYLDVILSLYHTSDIHVRLCWWLLYCFMILCVAVWAAWKMFGAEIAELSLIHDVAEESTKRKQSDRDEPLKRSDSDPGESKKTN